LHLHIPFFSGICDSLEIDVRIPRSAGMARKLQPDPTTQQEQTEEFYRSQVFILFLDLTISQLESRFSPHFHAASRLMYIIPSKCVEAGKPFWQ
jgi:hypothetical protein